MNDDTLYEKTFRISICLSIYMSLMYAFQFPVEAEQWQHFDYGGSIKCMISGGRSVWIGGEAGALLYDTNRDSFLRVTKELNARGESLQLSGSIVRDIAIDPRGRTWFACWDITGNGLVGRGLTMMDAVGFASFSEENILPSDQIFALSSDKQGRIWAGTEKGVTVFDEGIWTIYTENEGLYRNDAVEITIDPHGRVWCGFWRGINVYYDYHWWKWERERVDYVYKIISGNNNHMYCATKGGLAIYDGEQWEFALNRGDLRRRLISDMTMDANGQIWCVWGGLEKGVSIYDGTEWERITSSNSDNGLVSDRAIAIASDSHNRIWIGDRDGMISVMIPDGAPTISLDRFTEDHRYRGKTRGLSKFDSFFPEAEDTQQQLPEKENRLSNNQFKSKKSANPPTTSPPPLIAQANPPAIQFKITEPQELEASTTQAPYETDQKVIDITGGIASKDIELAKIEVNGFEAELKPPVDFGFGGPPIYPFEAKVLLKNIDNIHIEVFDKNDNSQGFRDYPIKPLAPAQESAKPEIHFLHPKITEEDLSTTRGGDIPIQLNMSRTNKAVVRGLVHDESGIEKILCNGDTVQYKVEASPSHLEEGGLLGEENVIFFEHRFDLSTGNNKALIEVIDLFDNKTKIAIDIHVQKALSDSMFYNHNYALIIGIDQYQSWDPLANAVRDAKGVRELLIDRLHFPSEQIYELYDNQATHTGILGSFSQLSNLDPQSRVLIFFAGHGQTITVDKKEKKGFLIPFDGVLPENEEQIAESSNSWLSMDQITEAIQNVEAKHILVILDACYSGLLTAKRSAVFGHFQNITDYVGFGEENALTAEFLRLSALNAVEVITAGSENEEVQDGGPGGHSFFTGLMIDGLKTGQADLSDDGVVTSEELGAFLSYEVRMSTGGKQHPAYSKLPGHENTRGLVLFSLAGTDQSFTSLNNNRSSTAYLDSKSK